MPLSLIAVSMSHASLLYVNKKHECPLHAVYPGRNAPRITRITRIKTGLLSVSSVQSVVWFSSFSSAWRQSNWHARALAGIPVGRSSGMWDVGSRQQARLCALRHPAWPRLGIVAFESGYRFEACSELSARRFGRLRRFSLFVAFGSGCREYVSGGFAATYCIAESREPEMWPAEERCQSVSA